TPCLVGPCDKTWSKAIGWLPRLGKAARPLIPAVERRLKDCGDVERVSGGLALLAAGLPGDRVEQGLRDFGRDDWAESQAFQELLERAGPAALAAVAHGLGSEGVAVRTFAWRVFMALQRVNSGLPPEAKAALRPAVPGLCRFLRNPHRRDGALGLL